MKKWMRKYLLGACMVALVFLLFSGSAIGEVDADGDGMDDEWESSIIRANGLNMTVAQFSKDADPDNDGATNIEEYEKRTDPYDGTDYLKSTNYAANEKVNILILLGAALCIGIPGILSAFGLYIAGVSAVGMTTEHTDRFGKGLILQALPMTQGVYGLVFAIFILMGAGFIGTPDSNLLANVNVGWGAVMIGVTISLTAVSAIPQGLVAGASASGVGRNPDVFGKSVVYSVMPETMAVFGFLIALFMTMGVGLL